LIAVQILPPPVNALPGTVSSENATIQLINFLNSPNKTGNYGALNAIDGEAVPGDQTLVVDCHGNWKTGCTTDHSVGLSLWMQALLVCPPILIALICIYACCCGPNNDLWFTHDKERKPTVSKRKSKKASIMEMAPLGEKHQMTSSNYSLNVAPDEIETPNLLPTVEEGPRSSGPSTSGLEPSGSRPLASQGSRPNLRIPTWSSKPPA